MASDVLCSRWTMNVVRELVCGWIHSLQGDGAKRLENGNNFRLKFCAAICTAVEAAATCSGFPRQVTIAEKNTIGSGNSVPSLSARKRRQEVSLLKVKAGTFTNKFSLIAFLEDKCGGFGSVRDRTCYAKTHHFVREAAECQSTVIGGGTSASDRSARIGGGIEKASRINASAIQKQASVSLRLHGLTSHMSS